jgi:hypothetical protein
MNRLILKYKYPVTAVILLILAWVIYMRISQGWSEITTLAIAAAIVWVLGVPTFIYLWPRITVNGFKRAILKRGFGFRSEALLRYGCRLTSKLEWPSVDGPRSASEVAG